MRSDVFAKAMGTPSNHGATGSDSAVDREYCTRSVSGPERSQEEEQVGDLVDPGRALERIFFQQLGVAGRVAQRVLRKLAQHVVDARRIDGSGVHPDHADVVIEAATAQCPGHRHDRGIAGSTRNILRIADLAAIADVVEDYASAARLHARVNETDHVRIAKSLERPALPPLFRPDVEDRSTGDD